MLREIVPPDTGLACAAMRELRTHLTSLEDFVEQVDSVQRPVGYRLVGVLPDDGTDAVAVAGFRLSRFAAHRLYLNSGYVISAHHFSRCI